MKKVLLFFTALFMSLFCQACTHGDNVNVETVSNFNLDRYLGEWYEIARFDHRFERNMQFTNAVYSLNQNGTVKVVNSGYRRGKVHVSEGKAKRPDPEHYPALFRVSFFLPFYSDYRVLMIDPDYTLALVSSKNSKYLWILSRDTVVNGEQLQWILTEAVRRGFDTSKLIWVSQ